MERFHLLYVFQNLERQIQLLSKNHTHQLNIEVSRHKETRRQLASLQEMVQESKVYTGCNKSHHHTIFFCVNEFLISFDTACSLTNESWHLQILSPIFKTCAFCLI